MTMRTVRGGAQLANPTSGLQRLAKVNMTLDSSYELVFTGMNPGTGLEPGKFFLVWYPSDPGSFPSAVTGASITPWTGDLGVQHEVTGPTRGQWCDVLYQPEDSTPQGLDWSLRGLDRYEATDHGIGDGVVIDHTYSGVQGNNAWQDYAKGVLATGPCEVSLTSASAASGVFRIVYGADAYVDITVPGNSSVSRTLVLPKKSLSVSVRNPNTGTTGVYSIRAMAANT